MEVCMKKTTRFLGIVTLAVFTVLIATGCYSIRRGVNDGVSRGVSNSISGIFGGSGSNSGGSSSSGNSGGRNTSNSRNSGSSQTVPWPADSVWSRYGLSGLQQPPRTEVAGAALYMGYYVVALVNGGDSAFDFLVAQIDKMNGAELISEMNTSDGKMVGYSIGNSIVNIIVDLDGDITIQITR
jgi:hypothetical protein